MNKRYYIVIASLIVLACTILSAAYSNKGPLVPEISIQIYSSKAEVMQAFQKEEIDLIPNITGSDIEKVKVLPFAQVITTDSDTGFYLILNTRINPLNVVAFRQAIAHMVDRELIVQSVLQGNAAPMYSIVPESHPMFHAGTPKWVFNVAKATSILDLNGFILNANGERTNPATKKPLETITLVTSDSEGFKSIARIIIDAMASAGITVVHEPVNDNDLSKRLRDLSFEMITAGYTADENIRYLWSLFHSANDYSGGSNYSGIRDESLDKMLDYLFSTDSKVVKGGANATQLILARLLPFIPIYSRQYVDVYNSRSVKGWVQMKNEGTTGANNLWSLLNLQLIDKSRSILRWPMVGNPISLNPLTANRLTDYEIISKIAPMNCLFVKDATSNENIGWVAKSWSVDQWTRTGSQKGTVITWKLRNDVKWSDGTPFTSADIKFTIEYLKNNEVQRYINQVNRIVKVETPDKYTAKVYFENVGDYLVAANLCGLPQHIWKDINDYNAFEPWNTPHSTIKGMNKLVGLGPYILDEYEPGEHIHLIRNKYYFALP